MSYVEYFEIEESLIEAEQVLIEVSIDNGTAPNCKDVGCINCGYNQVCGRGIEKI